MTPTPPPDQARMNRGVAPWGRVITHRLQQQQYRLQASPQRKRGKISPSIAKNNDLLSTVNQTGPNLRGSIYKGVLRQHFASSGGHARPTRGKHH